MAAPPAIPRRGLFIGGGWREPALGRRIPVINPATEDTIGSSRHPIPSRSPPLSTLCPSATSLSTLLPVGTRTLLTEASGLLRGL
jgi:hypothetical protein